MCWSSPRFVATFFSGGDVDRDHRDWRSARENDTNDSRHGMTRTNLCVPIGTMDTWRSGVQSMSTGHVERAAAMSK